MAEMLTKQQRKQDNRSGTKPKGKKPFKKKAKGKIVRVKRGEPTFLYLCHCHDERARKTPCERAPEDRAERKFSASPLGTWRCVVTHKKCKVRRQRNKQEEKIADVQGV